MFKKFVFLIAAMLFSVIVSAAQWPAGVVLTSPAPIQVSATSSQATRLAIANSPAVFAILNAYVNPAPAIGFCTPVSYYYYFKIENFGNCMTCRNVLVFMKQTCV